jgi:hypothetical protein
LQNPRKRNVSSQIPSNRSVILDQCDFFNSSNGKIWTHFEIPSDERNTISR